MEALGSDQDDWALATRGDSRAMARVYDRHSARLHRHAVALGAGPTDAEDIVAIVFLEAWRKREGVRFVDGSLLPWLLLTATFSSRNRARSRRRYRGFLDRYPRDGATAADPTDTFDDGAASDALRRLSPRDQEVITLCVLAGLSEGEAATVLRVPRGTVKSRLYRARARLQQQYRNPILTPSSEAHSSEAHSNEAQEAPSES
jgi:RNA polymerase sigma factor (sigma-70 family)